MDLKSNLNLDIITSPTSSNSIEEHKCVLVGPPEVGKTTLLQALLKKDVVGDTTPTVAAQTAVIRVGGSDGELHDLRIWDTAGQERFSALMPIYLRGAHLVLIVVSPATPKEVLESLESKLANMQWNPVPRVIHILNKTDLYDRHASFQAKNQLDKVKKDYFYQVAGEGTSRRWCCTAAKKKYINELLEELHIIVGRLPSNNNNKVLNRILYDDNNVNNCCM